MGLFVLMLLAGCAAAGVAYGLACAALRVSMATGALLAVGLLLAWLGFEACQTLSKPNVPPLSVVFEKTSTNFMWLAIPFLSAYFTSYSWLAARRIKRG